MNNIHTSQFIAYCGPLCSAIYYFSSSVILDAVPYMRSRAETHSTSAFYPDAFYMSLLSADIF